MLVDEVKYEKKPRVYYVGVASNGQKVIRGSNADKYTHAVANTTNPKFPNQIVNGSFHRTKELAEAQARQNVRWRQSSRYSRVYSDYGDEVVPLQKVTAKEIRDIKKLHKENQEALEKAKAKEREEKEERENKIKEGLLNRRREMLLRLSIENAERIHEQAKLSSTYPQ